MSEPTRDDLRVMILCGHQGTFHPDGSPLDGTKRHPLGGPIGFNRGGGRTYAEWCGGPQWAEFDVIARQEGYVRLPDVDVLRDRIAHALLTESWQHEGTDLFPSPVGWYPFAQAVLAALDPEGNTDG
jgi:hypothetical protein